MATTIRSRTSAKYSSMCLQCLHVLHRIVDKHGDDEHCPSGQVFRLLSRPIRQSPAQYAKRVMRNYVPGFGDTIRPHAGRVVICQQRERTAPRHAAGSTSLQPEPASLPLGAANASVPLRPLPIDHQPRPLPIQMGPVPGSETYPSTVPVDARQEAKPTKPATSKPRIPELPTLDRNLGLKGLCIRAISDVGTGHHAVTRNTHGRLHESADGQWIVEGGRWYESTFYERPATAGAWYFQAELLPPRSTITGNVHTVNTVRIGVGSSRFDARGPLGMGKFGFAVRDRTGLLCTDGKVSPELQPLVEGDTVGVTLFRVEPLYDNQNGCVYQAAQLANSSNHANTSPHDPVHLHNISHNRGVYLQFEVIRKHAKPNTKHAQSQRNSSHVTWYALPQAVYYPVISVVGRTRVALNTWARTARCHLSK